MYSRPMFRNLRELHQYRALLWSLTQRELKARYRGSQAGPQEGHGTQEDRRAQAGPQEEHSEEALIASALHRGGGRRRPPSMFRSTRC